MEDIKSEFLFCVYHSRGSDGRIGFHPASYEPAVSGQILPACSDDFRSMQFIHNLIQKADPNFDIENYPDSEIIIRKK